jgi:hypothetical protein
MTAQELITKDQPEDAGELVARLPKDHLRSLFYLFSGKPDSRIKVFDAPIHITKSDIAELNDCITRKLKTHSIDAQITSVRVGYIGADISEFGTWAEFDTHHWQESECIEEIVVKWDFMVKLDTYKIPQRHTLMMRISTDVKPGKVIQMLSSGNSDEFDQMDYLSAPAFCRVDFINAQISKELINQVTDWYKGRKSPALIQDSYYWFKKKKQTIAELVHHSLPFSSTMIFVALIYWLNANRYDGHIPLHIMGVTLMFGLYSLSPVNRLGHIFASRVFESLSKLEGSKVVFEFTSGDKKRISELQQENVKRGKKFIRECVVAIALNLFASVIYGWLFVSSHAPTT